MTVEPTSDAPGGWQSFSFSVPLLIHTTVLPPNLWGFAETYIPMNTKVYANFVKKSEVTAAVVGRFTTDHLLEGEYTPITSAKSENPSVRPQKEQRLVLNTHDFQTNQLLLSGVLVLGVGMILMGLFKRGTS